jgi:hypothetical protein
MERLKIILEHLTDGLSLSAKIALERLKNKDPNLYELEKQMIIEYQVAGYMLRNEMRELRYNLEFLTKPKIERQISENLYSFISNFVDVFNENPGLLNSVIKNLNLDPEQSLAIFKLLNYSVKNYNIDAGGQNSEDGLANRISKYSKRIEKPKLHINNQIANLELIPHDEDQSYTAVDFISSIKNTLVQELRIGVNSIFNGEKDFRFLFHPERITENNYDFLFPKLENDVSRKINILKRVDKPEEVSIEVSYTEKGEVVTEVSKYVLIAELIIGSERSVWYGINYKTPNSVRKTRYKKEEGNEFSLPNETQTA